MFQNLSQIIGLKSTSRFERLNNIYLLINKIYVVCIMLSKAIIIILGDKK